MLVIQVAICTTANRLKETERERYGATASCLSRALIPEGSDKWCEAAGLLTLLLLLRPSRMKYSGAFCRGGAEAYSIG